MDDWRIEGVAVCTEIENAVSGVGEEIDEGKGEVEQRVKERPTEIFRRPL